MEHTIQVFLKFGEEKRILDLYENGTVYLNAIEYFRKVEDGLLRGDKYEGVSKITNLPPGKMTIQELNVTVDYINIHLKEAYEVVLGNLYCIYCVSSHGWENPLDFKIDGKNAGFGEYCLMIKQPGVFIQKVENALKELNYKFRHDFVEYYDKNSVNGGINLFQKPLEFEHQKEFRFYVENEKIEPIKLNIGSMKDYAELFKTEDILEMTLSHASN